MEFWSRKTFCLISGASRGFGSSIARIFSRQFAPGSVLVLLARNLECLEKTKSSIIAERSDLKVILWTIDLLNANQEDLKKHFLELFVQEPECHYSKFTQCLLVHNAASLGNVSLPFSQLTDRKELNDYWSLNLTSVILLNSVFFSFFTKEITSHRYAVQISSLGAIKPFKFWGLYCGAKAARDIMFKLMSEEEEDVKILSYAPGPLDTDMFHEALIQSAHPETKALFEAQSKMVLTCEQSASKLVKLLGHEKYESGSHVDYFDVNDEGRIAVEAGM